MVDTKFEKGQIPWNKGVPMKEETKRKMSESKRGKSSLFKGKKRPELSGENHPMFGKHHSKESLKKMSESKKGKMVGEANPFYGKTHSEKTRRRISEANKGRLSSMKGKKTGKPAWNRGISPSEKSRKKMSVSQKRVQANPEIRRKMVKTRMARDSYKHTEEQKRKISLANKGRKISEKSRKKMSASQKRVWTNPNYKEKMVKIWTGKKHTPEAIQKMKEAHQKTLANPEVRERMRKAMKKRYESGEVPWNKGVPMKEEVKKKMSEYMKKRMSTPKNLELSRQNILKQYASGKFPKQENTKPERQLKEELIKRGYKEGIDFIHQYNFMNKFMCDFCFLAQKIIIEVDGDFWHVNPKKYPEGSVLHKHQIKDIGRDKSKTAYITKVDNGSWTLLRFWESNINKNVIECVDKIEEVLKSKNLNKSIN